MSKDQKLANPPGWRKFSDQLDKTMGWEGQYKDDSRVRGAIHGAWHYKEGVVTGKEKEFNRAKEQFSKTTRPLSPPAEKKK